MSLWRAAASRLLLRRSPSYAPLLLHARPFSPPPPRPAPAGAEVTPAEARRLVRLVAVEALKRRLRDGPDEVVGYADLLDAGAARTHADAEALARAMDDAGVVLLFRDKAYLHPDKVVHDPKFQPISSFIVSYYFTSFLFFYSVFRFGFVPFTSLLLWIWVYILANHLKMEHSVSKKKGT